MEDHSYPNCSVHMNIQPQSHRQEMASTPAGWGGGGKEPASTHSAADATGNLTPGLRSSRDIFHSTDAPHLVRAGAVLISLRCCNMTTNSKKKKAQISSLPVWRSEL